MREGLVPGKFEWRAARSTIPMAVGLSIAALRASVLPRTWALLMTALFLDNAVSMAIGLDRQKIARAWALSVSHALPERIRDLFDKAWVGPLGLVAPFLDLLSARTPGEVVRTIPAIFMTLIIWGIFGGAICRIAMTRMTQSPIPGYFEAIGYAAIRWRVIWGPLVIMATLAVILMAILAVLGAITSLPYAGPWLAWIVLPVMIVPASILGLTIAGVVLGWPMMLGAAMVEDSDSFDALSQSQSFLFQAPVTWALTTKIGILIHTAGYFVVRWFLRALVAILRGATGFMTVQAGGSIGTDWNFPDPWSMPVQTTNAFDFWISAIKLAAVTWPIGYVFAFSAALYLALKARVDLVPPAEVRIE